jgi:hypothetical protein
MSMLVLLYVFFIASIAALALCIWVAADRRARTEQRIACALFALPLFALVSVNLPLATIVPGAIGSAWFGSHLAAGLTRDQVAALRRASLGSDDGIDIHNLSRVLYGTGGSLCIVWGKQYELNFDRGDILRSWKIGEWSEGTCD